MGILLGLFEDFEHFTTLFEDFDYFVPFRLDQKLFVVKDLVGLRFEAYFAVGWVHVGTRINFLKFLLIELHISVGVPHIDLLVLNLLGISTRVL